MLTLLREKQRSSLVCNCHFENKVQQTFSGNYSLARLRLHSLFTTQPDSGRPEALSWAQTLSWDLVLGAMPATADDQQLSKAEGFRRYVEDKKVPASSGQFFFGSGAVCTLRSASSDMALMLPYCWKLKKLVKGYENISVILNFL